MQSGSTLTADSLADELGVSRRTLFRDLNMLEAAGIPYYNEGEGYRIVSSFFLPPVNLKVTEAMGLMTLAKVASEQRGQPMLEPALEAIRKLVTMAPAPLREVCVEMMENVTVRATAPAFVGDDRDHYHVLQKAIDQKRVVRMCYHSLFDGGDIEIELKPYHMHFAVRAWYVIGFSQVHKQVRTFRLSRIESMHITEKRFELKKPFSIDAYLGKAWSLIPEGRVHRVELEFGPRVGSNVCETQWHATQEHELLDDGRCLMSFEVDGLNEIYWWLLGYGDQVVVRSPQALRDRMAAGYRAALARYEDDGAMAEKKSKEDRQKGGG
jgi:proteasome accessory factor B